MRNTTTTVVIAAGVVLAAVIVTRTPAQRSEGPSGACCYANGECIVQAEIDCQQNLGVWQGAGVPCEGLDCVGLICGQTAPTVVAMSVSKDMISSTFTPEYRVFRTWSDGQVDMTVLHFNGNPSDQFACDLVFSCGPLVVLPGTCPTDVNRDGDTGIQDFLTLLGGWGACQ